MDAAAYFVFRQSSVEQFFSALEKRSGVHGA
jgi:hypothetical protein